MPDLTFEIISSGVKPFAAMPSLTFGLQITNNDPEEEVYAAALKCQVMIEAIKRNYSEQTKSKLHELFGPPGRWDETLKTFFWTTINIPVPRFTEQTVVEVLLPCTEDQAIAAGKYFYAVENETVPLAFLFSGTLFYQGASGDLQVTLVPWQKEALYKMPANIWHEMMESYFPNSRWLRIQKDLYDKLVHYKAGTTFHTLQDCLEHLLEEILEEKLNRKKVAL